MMSMNSKFRFLSVIVTSLFLMACGGESELTTTGAEIDVTPEVQAFYAQNPERYRHE